MSTQVFYQHPYARVGTNSWAVVALVCAMVGFLVAPVEILAVVFGHIARGQIRRSGEEGGGMALASLIVGYSVLALYTAVIVTVISLFAVVSRQATHATVLPYRVPAGAPVAVTAKPAILAPPATKIGPLPVGSKG
jgi:hypothetical protein